MKKQIPLVISAVALAAMCVFVFAMSAMPASDSNELSTGVIWHIVGFIVPGYDQLPNAEQLRWQEALQRPVRKTAHFLEYAALGALALNLGLQVAHARNLRGNDSGITGARDLDSGINETIRPAPALSQLTLAAWIFATAYAATDELHQLFVPGRTGQLTDVALDSTGALTGILILLAILAINRAIRRRQLNQRSSGGSHREHQGCP